MDLAVHMQRKDMMTIADWEEFFAHARRLGASSSSPVDGDYDDDDPYRPKGWTIEADKTGSTNGPDTVSLPTGLVHDLIHVLTALAESDGDVRAIMRTAQEAVAELNEHFRTLALGPSPWQPEGSGHG
jgi:hypothetical protein